MEPQRERHQKRASPLQTCWRWCLGLVVLMLSPMQNRPRGTQGPQRVSISAGALVLVLAIGIEAAALWWLAYLIDLCISLMEVWAELARKHLELTLLRAVPRS